MTDTYITQQKQLIKQIKNNLTENLDKPTLVEMQKDYENDDQRCLTSVVFIPEDIGKKISEKIIKPLKNIEPDHFYYPLDSMHLTIKNIRTIHKPPLFSSQDVNKVKALYQEIIPKFSSFKFSLQGLVNFPTSVNLIGYCDETLKKLVKALDTGLKQIGVPDDKKYFSNSVFFGNITVCRFTHQPSKSFIKKVKELENILIGELEINKINLITCNVVCIPKTRKVIGTYHLNNSS